MMAFALIGLGVLAGIVLGVILGVILGAAWLIGHLFKFFLGRF